MSSFTAARVIVGGPCGFIVRGAIGEGFTFWIGNPHSGLSVYVPEGFLTDGPSMPRWLRQLLPRWLLRWVRACLLKAAIVHDRLREDLQFGLIDTDAQFLVAMSADQPDWAGPRWAGAALKWTAFFAVLTNPSRARHNPVDGASII